MVVLSSFVSVVMAVLPFQGDWEVVGDYYQGVNVINASHQRNRKVIYSVRGRELTADRLGGPYKIPFSVRFNGKLIELDLDVWGDSAVNPRGVFLFTGDMIIASVEFDSTKPRPTTITMPTDKDTHTLIVMKRIK